MTKVQLKNIIKETVKECIREVLLENQVFASLMREVIMSTKQIILESKSNQQFSQQFKSSPEVTRYASSEFDKESAIDQMHGQDYRSKQKMTQLVENKNDKFDDNNDLDKKVYITSAELADSQNVVSMDTIKAMMGLRTR